MITTLLLAIIIKNLVISFLINMASRCWSISNDNNVNLFFSNNILSEEHKQQVSHDGSFRSCNHCNLASFNNFLYLLS